MPDSEQRAVRLVKPPSAASVSSSNMELTSIRAIAAGVGPI